MTTVNAHSHEIVEGILTLMVYAGGSDSMQALRWPILVFAKDTWSSVEIAPPTPAAVLAYYAGLEEYVKASIAAGGLGAAEQAQATPAKTLLH